jgi:hypothetical protein
VAALIGLGFLSFFVVALVVGVRFFAMSVGAFANSSSMGGSIIRTRSSFARSLR